MSSRRIQIFDTTLRDGEQSPGIALRPEEKAEVAEQLVPGEHPLRVGRQPDEQGVLLLRERDRRPGDRHDPRVQVDLDLARFNALFVQLMKA